jgi:hypothetical protein
VEAKHRRQSVVDCIGMCRARCRARGSCLWAGLLSVVVEPRPRRSCCSILGHDRGKGEIETWSPSGKTGMLRSRAGEVDRTVEGITCWSSVVACLLA